MTDEKKPEPTKFAGRYNGLWTGVVPTDPYRGDHEGKEQDPLFVLERLGTEVHWAFEHMAELKDAIGAGPHGYGTELKRAAAAKIGDEGAMYLEYLDQAVRDLQDKFKRLQGVMSRPRVDGSRWASEKPEVRRYMEVAVAREILALEGWGGLRTHDGARLWDELDEAARVLSEADHERVQKLRRDLDEARSWSGAVRTEIRLSPEAQEQLARILENPPPPAPKLVGLMRRNGMPGGDPTDEEMAEVYRRHFEGLVESGSSGGKSVEVRSFEKRELPGGRTALLARRSENPGVDLAGLRGRKVTTHGREWWVMEVESYGGLGTTTGDSDEVGLLARPA